MVLKNENDDDDNDDGHNGHNDDNDDGNVMESSVLCVTKSTAAGGGMHLLQRRYVQLLLCSKHSQIQIKTQITPFFKH